MAQNNHVQYGAGWCAPSGWRNFDCSPTLRLERLPLVGRFVQINAQRFPLSVEYGDIVAGLPVAAGSCSGIFASHVLEHLALNEVRIALKNTYDMLREGGRFRLVVPDLELLAREYLSTADAGAGEKFLNHSGLGRPDRPKGLSGFLRAILGNSHHLWMWDYRGMAAELTKVGFRDIRRCQFRDAEDPLFAKVEEADRFNEALAIEAVR